MAQRILIAAEGRTVFQPDGAPWPADGLPDPDTRFTRRRLADGDLIVKPARTARAGSSAAIKAEPVTADATGGSA